MTDKEQKKKAKEFADFWKGKGDEKGESQKFWLSLLRDVYGVEHPESFISFEDRVFLGHTSFIDGYIADTKVLIEQKAMGKDLKAPIKQSDGTLLTPFQQAKRYVTELPVDKHPKFIITSNFQSFLVYDMNNPSGEPEEILLENLDKDYYRLSFLVDSGNVHLKREMEVSIQAGEIVGLLYEAFLKQYKDPSNIKSLQSLNMLCVRIVFCLYAEDAGIFGKHSMFHDYLAGFDAKSMRKALIEFFKILDTIPEERDPYLEEELLQFPYVNGGLFSDENIEIPTFTEEIRALLLSKASDGFNWSDISPTIFGAVFESTLNPETRRSGGMHYTSIENIHKVIDPLFLDDLKKELEEIKGIAVAKTRERKLKAYQEKLSKLTFFDPACGSGNFLTETYISLRRLENEALKTLYYGQITFATQEANPIKVSISQFYGIEINDFAVTVGKTALWIAESQMLKETEDVIHMNLEFLPLKTYANIIEGNALRLDWEGIVPKNNLNYIMGNPPFVGFTFMSNSQKEDMLDLFPKTKNLDLVCGWYKKASDFIKGKKIECGFVSTNSITQGETVPRFWQFVDYKINFAYRTFIWDNEAKNKAHVHCVIIGFADFDRQEKWIYQNDRKFLVQNINAYLLDAPNILIESRTTPICKVSKMIYGNKPADGGNLIIEEEDYENFIKEEPESIPFIKPLLGAAEFLHNKKRYCLWLVGISPATLNSLPKVKERVALCKEARQSSIAQGIRKFAETPTLFAQITQPAGKPFIIIPRVSSERRRYVPMAFLDGGTIVSDAVQIVPDATIYEFGVLNSNVHMSWMRAFCGRLKSDYRYSKDVVYNNFYWCSPTDEQKAQIEKTAQGILDARKLYPDSSLADLYDEVSMPPELRRAHQENDKAVMRAYGLPIKETTESSCVAFLMGKYKELAG